MLGADASTPESSHHVRTLSSLDTAGKSRTYTAPTVTRYDSSNARAVRRSCRISTSVHTFHDRPDGRDRFRGLLDARDGRGVEDGGGEGRTEPVRKSAPPSWQRWARRRGRWRAAAHGARPAPLACARSAGPQHRHTPGGITAPRAGPSHTTLPSGCSRGRRRRRPTRTATSTHLTDDGRRRSIERAKPGLDTRAPEPRSDGATAGYRLPTEQTDYCRYRTTTSRSCLVSLTRAPEEPSYPQLIVIGCDAASSWGVSLNTPGG